MAEQDRETSIQASAGSLDDVTEPEPSGSAILSVLRISSFRWLIVDNAFGATGFQAITMIQAWVILELTDSDAWVGVVNGVPAIPAVLIVLFAGVMADRINRRTILIWSRVGMAIVGLSMGLLVAAGFVGAWQLLILATVFGLARVVAVVASQTMVVDVVGRDRLFMGNALYGTTFNMAFFAGPAVGGILLANFGADTAFVVAGVMLVIAAIGAIFVRVPNKNAAPTSSSVFKDLKDGISYIRAEPSLRWLAAMAFFLMFAGAYFPLVPRIARDSLGAGADGYGSILAAQGIGTMAGSVALIASGNVRAVGRALMITSIVFGSFMVAFAFVDTLFQAWVVGFGIGAAIPWWANSMRTGFQLPTSEEMRGRVMSLFAMATQAVLFGWVVGGIASEIIGPRPTAIFAGIIPASFYVFAYLKSSDLRRLGRDYTDGAKSS